MRTKLFIIITFLLISTLPVTMITHGETDDNPIPPLPKFIAVVPRGDAGNHIFAVNTTVVIKYQADRFDVDGLILVGNGSGLVEDPESPLAVNFTKIGSIRDISTYEVELNVTSYTYFLAYSWV